jgi:hypothetical protein
MAAQQRRDVGGGTRFIGNMVDLRAGGDFQKLQVEMARAAYARGATAYLAGVLLAWLTNSSRFSGELAFTAINAVVIPTLAIAVKSLSGS